MRMRVAIVYNEPEGSYYGTGCQDNSVLAVLESVYAVRAALRELRFDVTVVPLLPPLRQAEQELRNLDADLVFNLFEGFGDQPETEAAIAQILSELGMPFTGCPPPALRLALDKAETKEVLRAAGIKTPDFQLLDPETLDSFHLDYPCIVKPRCHDASNGLSPESVVCDFTALQRQVSMLSSFPSSQAIVEKLITGRELNATVIGNTELTVFPVSEIVYSLPPGMPEILTFEAKWQTDSIYFKGTTPVCPADIDAEQHERIAEIAMAAYRLVGCRGYARVDMRRDQQGELNVIEVNPNPDISPEAGTARQALAAGMTYTQFIEQIVRLALDRKYYDTPYPLHVRRRQGSRSTNTSRHARIQTF